MTKLLYLDNYRKNKGKTKEPRESWRDVDWSLTDVQLAKKLGCCVALVKNHRPRCKGKDLTP